MGIIPRIFRAPCAPLGSSASTVRRSSSRVPPTLVPSERPPSCRAFTGLPSMRLLVSAARRISSSPMVRTSFALAVKSGEPVAVPSRPEREESTVSFGTGRAGAGTEQAGALGVVLLVDPGQRAGWHSGGQLRGGLGDDGLRRLGSRQGE